MIKQVHKYYNKYYYAYFAYLKNLPETSVENSFSETDDKFEFIMATETDSVTLKTILEKLTLLEESIKVLNAENTKRTQEISMIARHNNLIETEDESSGNRLKNTRTNVREDLGKPRANRFRESSPFISSGDERESTTDTQTQSITAKDIIGTIEVLNGKDDCSVEDFIKIVKKAHKRCSQKDLLLDLILSQN